MAIALEQHIPKIVVTGAPGVGVHDVMAELGQYVLHGDALVALDIIGAWTETYARLPGTRWLRDAEAAFLAMSLER